MRKLALNGCDGTSETSKYAAAEIYLSCRQLKINDFQIPYLYAPLRTLELWWASKYCSTHVSADCKIQACAILFLGAWKASQSNADWGQYSAASQTRCKTNWEKHGRPEGPPWVSVNKVKSLKKGPHNSVCLVTDVNNMVMIWLAKRSSQRQRACIKCLVWWGFMLSLICWYKNGKPYIRFKDNIYITLQNI